MTCGYSSSGGIVMLSTKSSAHTTQYSSNDAIAVPSIKNVMPPVLVMLNSSASTMRVPSGPPSGVTYKTNRFMLCCLL